MPTMIVQIIGYLTEEQSYAEIVVLFYIMRHTWGFSEYEKPRHLTLDEFANGRCYHDPERTRMDDGTRLTRSAIQRALKRLEARNVIEVTIDSADPHRIRKSYRLRIR